MFLEILLTIIEYFFRALAVVLCFMSGICAVVGIIAYCALIF